MSDTSAPTAALMKPFRRLALLALLFLISSALRAQFDLPGAANEEARVTPSLLADTAAVVPGQPFTVAVRLRMKQGWHVYWQFGGDSGAPPRVEWTLPEGFKVGPPQWPLPTAHVDDGDLLTYIYEGEVALLFEVTPPSKLTAREVALKGAVSWLVCEKICVPGKGDVALTLPVAGSAEAANAEQFAKFRAALPQTGPAPFQTKWQRNVDEFTVRVSGVPKEARVEFFPLPPSPEIKPEHPEVGAPGEDGARTIKVPISDSAGKADTAWRGLLVIQSGDGPRQGWMISAEGEAARAETAAAELAPVAPQTPMPRPHLLLVVLSALLGGLILNVMPCVLPVIALKIFGFVQQAGQEPGRIFRLGLAFAAGVFVFFLSLAAAVVALKAFGRGFNFGFQLQNPFTLAALIALVFVFGLNLLGVFEVMLGGEAATKLSTLSSREGYSGAFLHGLFTTLLGTSCTAPFLAGSLGTAVTQPAPVVFLVFAAVALGMSAPYVLLTARPGWMRYLPKPGVWMERFKQVMGFLLLAVAVWLFSVLAGSRPEAAVALSWYLLALAVACWLLGAFARRATTWALVTVLVIGGYFFLLHTPLVASAETDATRRAAVQVESARKAAKASGIQWEPFSEARVAEAVAAGKPVFVDFTAAWCLNCKVFERTVLHTDSIRTALREKAVVPLLADWTDHDPDITAALKRFDRIGVPLYLLYRPGEAQPVVMDGLTQGGLLEELGKIRAK